MQDGVKTDSVRLIGAPGRTDAGAGGERWYDENIGEVYGRLGSDPDYGLTDEIAEERLKRCGSNVLFEAPKVSAREHLNNLSPGALSALTALIAVLLAVFGKWVEALLIVLTIAFSYFILFMTNLRAMRILEQARSTSLPTASVIRGGRKLTVRQELIVPGDVFLLKEGDLIPADARLIETDDLRVLETGITENVGEVRKDAAFTSFRNLTPGACKNLVYASTIVTGGRGKAIAYATGPMTMIALRRKNRNPSAYANLPLFRNLRKLSLVSTLLSFLFVFILGILSYARVFPTDDPLYDLLCVLSCTLACMTEFYPAFGYIIVARGIFSSNTRARRQSINEGALIRHPEKLNVMKRIDCLLICPETLVRKKDIRLECVTSGDRIIPIDGELTDSAKRVLSLAVVSTGLYGGTNLVSAAGSEKLNSFEVEAILSGVERAGLYNSDLEKQYPLLDHMEAGGECRFDTGLYFGHGQFVGVFRGQAEEILDACTDYLDNGRTCQMTQAARSRFMMMASQLMRESYCVIAVATALSRYNRLKRIGDLQKEMTFEGFIGLKEPVLPGAARAIESMAGPGNAGKSGRADKSLHTVLLCRDRSEKNFQLAKSLGLLSEREEAIDRLTMQNTDPGILQTKIGSYALFEDVDDETSENIVGMLKKAGYTVAMSGMRLTEVPAMRAADLSITQATTLSGKADREGILLMKDEQRIGEGTQKGCDALRFVADVVVSDVDEEGKGGVNAAIESLKCARMIYSCVDRLKYYLFAMQTVRFLLTLTKLIFGFPLVSALKLLMSGLVADLFAVMITAFEPRTIGFTRPVKGLCLFVQSLASALFLFSGTLLSARFLSLAGRLQAGQLSTYCFYALLLGGISLLIVSENLEKGARFSVRLSNMFSSSLAAGAAFLLFCNLFPKFGAIFGIVRLSWHAWLGALAVFAAEFIAATIFRLLFTKILEKE